MVDSLSVFHFQYITDKFIGDGVKDSLNYAKGILLDLGCGDSPYRDLIKDKIDYYIGLNFFQDEIKDKNQSYVNIIAKGEKLPFNDNSIDTVLCTEVLEHVPEPEIIIEEIRRVLKKKGFIILSVPQVWYLHHKPYDYWRFTKFGLEYLIKKHNFGIIKIESRGNFWLTVAQMFNYYFEYSFSSLPKKKFSMSYFMHMIIRTLRKYIFALCYYLFSFLDKFDKVNLDTLGYLAVARKE